MLGFGRRGRELGVGVVGGRRGCSAVAALLVAVVLRRFDLRVGVAMTGGSVGDSSS